MAGGCFACPEKFVLTRYNADRCKAQRRKYTGACLVGVKCSADLGTGFLDTAEGGIWDTLLAAGDILLMPNCAKVLIEQGSTSVIGKGKCGEDIPGVSTFNWTYEDIDADEDYEDERFYAELCSRFPQYRWFFVDVCGAEYRVRLPLSVCEAIEAGDPIGNPGLNLSITSLPFFGGDEEGEIGKWTMSGTFQEDCNLVSKEVPGLKDLIAQY